MLARQLAPPRAFFLLQTQSSDLSRSIVFIFSRVLSTGLVKAAVHLSALFSRHLHQDPLL